MYSLEDCEKVCGNCEHYRQLAITTAQLGIMPLNLQNASPLGYCACGAVEPDAGERAIILLSDASNCINYADAFEPSQEFLATLDADVEDILTHELKINPWELEHPCVKF